MQNRDEILGMVTPADLLEEMIGEVNDSFHNEGAIQPLPDRSNLACGLTRIEEGYGRFSPKPDDPIGDTIAGEILGHLERFAQIGDSIQVDGMRLHVEVMEGFHISHGSMSHPRQSDPQPPEPAPDAN